MSTGNTMKVYLQQTQHVIGDFDSILKDLVSTVKKAKEGELHVFPETYTTGYPLKDLCLQKTFIEKHEKFMKDLNKQVLKLKAVDTMSLVGGLEYELSKSGNAIRIYNVIYKVIPGQEVENIYQKKLLPNYDIFDEMKYFTPGTQEGLIQWRGKNIALLVCEDMWSSGFHQMDPCQELYKKITKDKIDVHLTVNLSASPFNINKQQNRISRGSYISHLLDAPFVYVNRVGGEDDILFDGQSFVVDGDNIVTQLESFKTDTKIYELPEKEQQYKKIKPKKDSEFTWEDLFTPTFTKDSKLLKLENWSDESCKQVLQALIFGVRSYIDKTGFKNFTIALSGGIDSAIVLSVVRMALRDGEYLEAVYMPSKFSSTLSFNLSKEICQKLGVKFYSLPIKFLHSASTNLFDQTFAPQKLEGLADENIQSRLRGTLLFSRSNAINSLVFNTSNKSEIAVGYSTLYGDSVGAISVIGDLYKSQVYHLSRYINKVHGEIIPSDIIERPPSAELRDDQKDSDSLPDYDRLDAMLEGLLSYQMSDKDLIKNGFTKDEVSLVMRLYQRSEYKRAQFCPILKVSAKSFGFGYRIPITKKFY